MTGPVLILAVLVVGFPLLFMVSGALVSVVLGHVLCGTARSGSRETSAWS